MWNGRRRPYFAMTAAATATAMLAAGCSGGGRAPATSQVAAAQDPGSSPRSAAVDLATGLPDAMPTLLTIPKIRVKAPVEQTGADDSGNPVTPPFNRPDEVGWFTRTATPGSRGSAVIWGHLDTPTGTAVFLHLSTLAKGDLVQVSRDDGTVATFTVEKTAAYPKTAFPGDLVYDDPGYPALRLVTCGGSFDRKSQQYDENVVVFARLTSATAPLVAIPHPAPVNLPIPQPSASPEATPTKGASSAPARRGGSVPSAPQLTVPDPSAQPAPAHPPVIPSAPVPAPSSEPSPSSSPSPVPSPSVTGVSAPSTPPMPFQASAAHPVAAKPNDGR
jgi:sortase (surface protein transpeptidase)